MSYFFARVVPVAGLAAAPLEADRSLKAGTVASAIQSAHVHLATSDKQARRKNDSLQGTRFGITHILSLPPTARLVSGVASPAPRSMTLRRVPEIAVGLEALEACCGVG